MRKIWLVQWGLPRESAFVVEADSAYDAKRIVWALQPLCELDADDYIDSASAILLTNAQAKELGYELSEQIEVVNGKLYRVQIDLDPVGTVFGRRFREPTHTMRPCWAVFGDSPDGSIEIDSGNWVGARVLLDRQVTPIEEVEEEG